MIKLVAVTGGTGFVGAALIERLLADGYSVRALARNPSKLAPRAGVGLVEGDLEDDAALMALVDGAGAFIHCAGLTHARRVEDYHRVNVKGAANAAASAARVGARFVHASSLSARQPDLSPYARSKRDSETAVAQASGANPWVALRLPAIYGPGDRASLPLFRLAKAGLAIEPWTRDPARASILMVEDAAAALIAALKGAPRNAVYDVDDGRAEGYSWSEIGARLGEAFGKRVTRLKAPRPIFDAVNFCQRLHDRFAAAAPVARAGQVDELFHPDWVARDNLLSAAAQWRARMPLAEGFAKTARWYQEKGLL